MDINFMTGQVVEWKNGLWIISKVHTTDDGLQGLELINLNHSNVSAYPTKKWPSKKDGINSVKIVTDCMKDFFKDKIENLFQWK